MKELEILNETKHIVKTTPDTDEIMVTYTYLWQGYLQTGSYGIVSLKKEKVDELK